jgi:hypothetical protein
MASILGPCAWPSRSRSTYSTLPRRLVSPITMALVERRLTELLGPTHRPAGADYARLRRRSGFATFTGSPSTGKARWAPPGAGRFVRRWPWRAAMVTDALGGRNRLFGDSCELLVAGWLLGVIGHITRGRAELQGAC